MAKKRQYTVNEVRNYTIGIVIFGIAGYLLAESIGIHQVATDSAPLATVFILGAYYGALYWIADMTLNSFIK